MGGRAGDSPRGRAEPGPGVASPPMPPRPSAPVLRGSRRGPPRVRGWAMGGGRWGGELVRRAGNWSSSGARPPCPPRRGGPPPPLASACRRGVVRTLLVGGPPPRVRGVWCHPCAAGRIAIVWLVVEWPSRHWPCVAVPGGRQWWPARGSVPRWRAWAGTGRGRSVARACRRSAGRARSPAIPPRHAGRAPPRALCAPGGQVCLGSLPRAQSPTHTAVRRFARRAAAASRWASPRP